MGRAVPCDGTIGVIEGKGAEEALPLNSAAKEKIRGKRDEQKGVIEGNSPDCVIRPLRNRKHSMPTFASRHYPKMGSHCFVMKTARTVKIRFHSRASWTSRFGFTMERPSMLRVRYSDANGHFFRRKRPIPATSRTALQPSESPKSRPTF